MTGNGNEQMKMQNEHKLEAVNLPATVLGEQSLAVDLARAEIDEAIATAHRYPRVLDTVIKKIETLACYNEQAAENCIYSLPRGGKPIIGASIGFANIIASCWGNCSDGARIVHIDRHEKVVIAEGGFHDLETNRKTVLPVQRRIVDKYGRIFSDDMIMVTGMAAASIARRNAILNAVPRAIWFPIYEKALQIVRGTEETFAERKGKAIKAFAQFGIKPDQIYALLGLKGEPDLTLEHLPVLRGMYGALRDGSVTVEELTDPRRMTAGAFDKVANPLGDEETVDQQTGEVKPKKVRGRPKTKKHAGEAPALYPESDKITVASGNATATIEHGKVTNVSVNAPAPAASGGGAGSTVISSSSTMTEPEAFNPRNAAEYHAYLRKWLAFVTTVDALEEAWRADRNLRDRCGVTFENLDDAMDIKNERVRELKK
jgi:hypothetical protein